MVLDGDTGIPCAGGLPTSPGRTPFHHRNTILTDFRNLLGSAWYTSSVCCSPAPGRDLWWVPPGIFSLTQARMPYSQKTAPFKHQAELYERTRDMKSHALFLEMGTGKTKIVIDIVGHLFESGEINGVLVLAPKAVAPNWVNDELPLHFGVEPGRYRVFLWDTAKAGNIGYQEKLATFLATPPDILAILVQSYDAIMTERRKGTKRGVLKGLEAAKHLLTKRRCMFVLDESARIKTPKAKRTKRVLAASKYAPYRRIMTGTPITQGPFDMFSQLRFLDADVWKRMGCGSFPAFKTMFGDWLENVRSDNGQRFQTLIGYKNLAALSKVVDQMGDRLLKEDVLDLPPKLYDKRTFEMGKEQRQLYDELRREFVIWLDAGDAVTAPLAITRLLRLQQITSGYLPTDDGNMIEIEPNDRLACFMEAAEDVHHQAIAWGRFQKDVDLMEAALLKAGKTCVVYDGRTSQTDREERRAAFKAGDVQWFVGNPAAAGEGLTLLAPTVIYYSNSFKLGDRLQSEDRAHRIGQDKPVLYVDIIARGTLDRTILRALRDKVDLASQVLGDDVRSWL